MVIILADHLKATEIRGHLQEVLIPLVVLLLRPDVAVSVAEDGLIALVNETLEAACGTRPAAAMDKNLLAHAIMILHILKLNHT